MVFENQEQLDPDEDVWESSAAAPRGFGPVRYLRVFGDSMAPDYPPGCLIAVKQTTLKPNVFPDNFPVILQERHGGDATFKLIQVLKDARTGKSRGVLGVPVNKEYGVLTWRIEDVAVSHVVLGKIEVLSEAPRVKRGPVVRQG